MLKAILCFLARLIGRRVRMDLRIAAPDTERVQIRAVTGPSAMLTINVPKVNKFLEYVPIAYQGEPGHCKWNVSRDLDHVDLVHVRNQGEKIILGFTITAANRALDLVGF